MLLMFVFMTKSSSIFPNFQRRVLFLSYKKVEIVFSNSITFGEPKYYSKCDKYTKKNSFAGEEYFYYC